MYMERTITKQSRLRLPQELREIYMWKERLPSRLNRSFLTTSKLLIWKERLPSRFNRDFLKNFKAYLLGRIDYKAASIVASSKLSRYRYWKEQLPRNLSRGFLEVFKIYIRKERLPTDLIATSSDLSGLTYI